MLKDFSIQEAFEQHAKKAEEKQSLKRGSKEEQVKKSPASKGTSEGTTNTKPRKAEAQVDASNQATKENSQLHHTNEVVFTPKIAVLGVGGCGNNAVDNLQKMDLDSVTFIIANTDVKTLKSSKCENKIRLGVSLTRGLGAGANPEVGLKAAEQSKEEIEAILESVDLLVIVAGMGGGTGTGASPYIAQIAKQKNILTLGFVTMPFGFEGESKLAIAQQGLAKLEQHIDSLTVLANQHIFKVITEDTSMIESMRVTDKVIYSAIKAISDLITANGMVNLDFNDIKAVISEGGRALVSSVEINSGADKATKVIESVLNNPLLSDDITLTHAKKILISLTGGKSMTLFEVDRIINSLRLKAAHSDYLNFGAVVDNNLQGKVRVSVIATGIGQTNKATSQEAKSGANFFKKREKTLSPEVEASQSSVIKPAARRQGSMASSAREQENLAERVSVSTVTPSEVSAEMASPTPAGQQSTSAPAPTYNQDYTKSYGTVLSAYPRGYEEKETQAYEDFGLEKENTTSFTEPTRKVKMAQVSPESLMTMAREAYTEPIKKTGSSMEAAELLKKEISDPRTDEIRPMHTDGAFFPNEQYIREKPISRREANDAVTPERVQVIEPRLEPTFDKEIAAEREEADHYFGSPTGARRLSEQHEPQSEPESSLFDLFTNNPVKLEQMEDNKPISECSTRESENIDSSSTSKFGMPSFFKKKHNNS